MAEWAVVTLSRKRKKRFEMGHPWIFVTEIESISGDPEPGAIVAIHDEKGRRVGTGTYHPTSQIRVRVFSEGAEAPVGLLPGVGGMSKEWIATQLREAWTYRQRWVTNPKACRVLFGEADFVPGLVADRFDSVIVIQLLTVGTEVARDAIVAAIREVFEPLGVKGIYERSDVGVRMLEGLELRTGVLWGVCPDLVDIEENGIQLSVDIVNGQKTGYFFDQQLNRRLLKPLMQGWGVRGGVQAIEEVDPSDGSVRKVVRNSNGKEVTFPFWDGATVLDAFSHSGGFTMNACNYGAKSVTCLDVSETAVEQARANMARNGFSDRVEFVCADAFEFLRNQVSALEMRKERSQAAKQKVDTSVALPKARQWDVIILDPPAFAKSRNAVDGALRGYKEINLQALKLISDGGFLVTASCSYHVHPELFMEVVQAAAIDAGKTLRLIEFRGAGPDHPQRIGVEEGNYLKFAIFEVRTRRSV